MKDSIRLEESNGRILSGKTGTSVINGELHAGWFVGYVETAENTFSLLFIFKVKNGLPEALLPRLHFPSWIKRDLSIRFPITVLHFIL